MKNHPLGGWVTFLHLQIIILCAIIISPNKLNIEQYNNSDL